MKSEWSEETIAHSNQFRQFRVASRELMEECYKTDEQLARKLLTYELNNWGDLTSLSIASMNEDREFMKHPW